MDKDIILLASGPSVRGYNLRDLELRGKLIALNGAAIYTKPHVAFTMDRKVSEFCYPIWQIQGVPQIWLRECIVKNYTIGPRTNVFQHDGPDTFMTPVPNKLNGSNSGTCALNLAYQYRPRRVFLFGYDMMRSAIPYWHEPYSWNTTGGSKDGKLREWSEEFRDIAPQFEQKGIEVFNVNDWGTSRLKAFRTIDFKEFERLSA